jgi:hypothetical protein
MIDTLAYPFPMWLAIILIAWSVIGLLSIWVYIQSFKKIAYIKYNENFWKTQDYYQLKTIAWFLPLVFAVGGILMVLCLYLDYPKLITFRYYKIPDIETNKKN